VNLFGSYQIEERLKLDFSVSASARAHDPR
jgi:hypothetical protein